MRAQLASHAALTFATLGVFARAVPHPLQRSWDDGRFILDNPLVHEVSWRSFIAIVKQPHFEAYHPLHLLGYWLDVPWLGANASALHVTSLALWVLAGNVLLAALRALGLGALGALVATLACVLHPVQVEAVSWATGRKDVLALLFTSACLFWHLRSERGTDRYAWGSRLMFALAALSKTTVLPLPAVLVLVDLLLRGHTVKRALRAQAPNLVAALASGAGVFLIWRSEAMIRDTPAPLGELPLRVVATLAHSLHTALWPDAVSPMYATKWSLTAPVLLIAIAVAATLVVAVRTRSKRALFACGAFALLLLPVSNAVPMYFPYQDRYLSLPLLALGFGLGAFVDAHARSRLVSALAVLALTGLALRTVQYQGAWQSETRLWGHAASTQPDAYYAWMKLGEVRRDAGELDGSIRAYRRLVELEPARKAGHAALLQVVALRDEKWRGLSPSLAERYAQELYAALDDASELRALAGRMLQTGHLRALELPMDRALRLQPFPDPALERAARTHFEAGRPSVGLFYLERMKRPTRDEALRKRGADARRAQATAPI